MSYHKLSAADRRYHRNRNDTPQFRHVQRERNTQHRNLNRHEEIAYAAFSSTFGYIKLGHSACFKPRWAVLRSGCPDLDLACIIYGGREVEHLLHDILDEENLRVEGEWFRAPEGANLSQVRAYIRQLLADYPEFEVRAASQNYLEFLLTGDSEAA